MPKIKASIPNRTLYTAADINKAGGALDNGCVVHSIHGVGIGGPFLVCEENEYRAREVSGCPNGTVHTFLVSLENGQRYNLNHFDPGTKFFLVDCEMVVSG